MDESGKQLGALILAIVVVLALIGIARVVFKEGGVLQEKIEDELDKITAGETTGYVMNQDVPLSDGSTLTLVA